MTEIPDRNCPLCPRLANFRADNRKKFPDFYNAPVPSFGPTSAQFLVLGLAPGVKGANRTGRPFTGDYAGELLYSTLLKYGFAEGQFLARPDDGLTLTNCRIVNAVRCVPPENKPTPAEIMTCNNFLRAELTAMPKLKAILALGNIAHTAVLRAADQKPSRFKFSHGARHELENRITLFNSYHCSRLNTNTGRLTEAMFHQVFDQLKLHLS